MELVMFALMRLPYLIFLVVTAAGFGAFGLLIGWLFADLIDESLDKKSAKRTKSH